MSTCTILGCALAYLLGKLLAGYKKTTLNEACVVAVILVLFNAGLVGIWDGALTDYPSMILGVLLGYAALRFIEIIER